MVAQLDHVQNSSAETSKIGLKYLFTIRFSNDIIRWSFFEAEPSCLPEPIERNLCGEFQIVNKESRVHILSGFV